MDQPQPNIGYGPLPNAYPGNQFDQGKRKKLAIIFVVVMVVIIGIVASVLLSNRKDPAQDSMVTIAAHQNEILRLAEEYDKNLSGAGIKGHNAELRLSTVTSSQKMTAELKRLYSLAGVPQLAQSAAKDAAVAEDMKNAIRLDRADETYARIISEKLAAQLDRIPEAQGLVKSQQTKEVLSELATEVSDFEKRFSE